MSKPTQKETVLAMLEAAGDRGVTSAEFYAAYLPRFSARLLELREDGHVVSSERLRDSSWRYTLLNQPAVSSAPRPVETTPRASSSTSRGPDADGTAVLPVPGQDASALTRTDAETGIVSSPPGPSCSGADHTAEASPEPLPSKALDESSGDAKLVLFDTVGMEFDHMIPPASPYDVEAA